MCKKLLSKGSVMFAYEQVVTFIFRLINTAVLAAIIWYLLKKYVLKSIADSIAARSAAIHNLEQQNASLQHKQQKLKAHLIEQDALCRELLEKVTAWQQAIVEEKKVHAQYVAERTQEFGKRLLRQKNALIFARLQKPVVEQAVVEAEKNLQSTFTQPQEGKKYLDTIITYLERV